MIAIEDRSSSDAAPDETTDLLIRARGLLERGWCQGIDARDANGYTVGPNDPRAVAWCAAGALCAAGMPPFVDDHPAKVRLGIAIGTGESIAAFNYSQKTIEPVFAAFDRAIAASNPVAAGSLQQ